MDSLDSSNSLNQNSSISDYFSKVISVRWLRFALIGFLGICTFLLLQLVGSYVLLLFFTVLPLIFGYALVAALRPLIRFFRNFFNETIAKICALIFTIFFILAIVGTISIIFIFQIENLYNNLIKADGSGDINQILKRLSLSEQNNGIPVANINEIKFVQVNSNDSYKLTIKTLTEVSPLTGTTAVKELTATFTKKNSIGGFYSLIFLIINEFSWFQSIGIGLIGIAYGWGSLGYFELILNNFWILAGFFYLIFFSMLIAIFALFEPPRHFFARIWNFFLRGQPKPVARELTFELKTKMKGWMQGLLIDQFYIFIGSSLVLMLVGIIFQSADLLRNAFILGLIMAFFNLIPYLGPWIGGVIIGSFSLSTIVNTDPSVFLNWLPFIFVMLGILLIQIGESAFVAPWVYSSTVDMSPIAIIMVLLIFGVLFGIWMMPFAIPTVLIIQTISSVIYRWKWTI